MFCSRDFWTSEKTKAVAECDLVNPFLLRNFPILPVDSNILACGQPESDRPAKKERTTTLQLDTCLPSSRYVNPLKVMYYYRLGFDFFLSQIVTIPNLPQDSPHWERLRRKTRFSIFNTGRLLWDGGNGGELPTRRYLARQRPAAERAGHLFCSLQQRRGQFPKDISFPAEWLQ